ncbi:MULTISPECIES: MFS transporter [Staphylococcus]|uniref:Arabinose ABC transporter permease n=1 Tax=Staphylococcus equorum TaxID=246432 RepID=A0AAP7IEK6_9STAP|nr:MFS transporter [Staphylococcus equorum]ANR67171.1 arabinose ABC transporter permease [Staphylococcus equorum]ERH34614.1 MFS transporter [Staphylococcus equorum UMC-CNS-924]KKI53676.1 putative transporter [Staphylococcus equorum subsp. equorum]MCE5008006.1 MFS transporter [Staphylococcus equorum]MCE5048329.1 MFS transporter [Staphylococcus equorum]
MKNNNLIILILTIGVFGILNTEMGFIGLIPQIAERFGVSTSTAGWLVSIFAIGIAISGPIMPLLLSKLERKKVMIIVLLIFIISNIISVFTTSFTVLLIARVIPAIFHPVYIALAFSVASDSVNSKDAPKAVARVFIGVSSGMVVGVPIVNFLATQFNLSIALSFFALVNIIVLILTLIFIPKMPTKKSVTYGTQLSVLKRPLTWISILVSILFNAAIFGVYSYLTDYLNIVTEAPSHYVSIILFLYGISNILGNIIAGKLLTSIPQTAIFLLPFALIIIYVSMFGLGSFLIPMAIISIFWGTLAGISANITQYVITSSAPDAPDLSNGIFLSAVNSGTTIGTFIGGIFITTLGSNYVIMVGILACVINILFILIRNKSFKKQDNIA